jgi:molybdate transport system ATP-binding protein
MAVRTFSRRVHHRRPLHSWWTTKEDARLLQRQEGCLRHLTSLYGSPKEEEEEHSSVVVDDDPSRPLVSLNPHTIRTYPTTTSTSTSTNTSTSDNNHKDNQGPLLLSFQFNPKATLAIAYARHGGHVLLGRNGSGKSLISNAIAEGFLQFHRSNNQQKQSSSAKESAAREAESSAAAATNTSSPMTMTFSDDQVWHAQAVAHVSFESHQELLSLRDEHHDGQTPVTVQKAIAQGGALNKAAQFLVVRFGLFPLLHRQVTTLSTGEIRKVLLIRALAKRPRLLVLDNALDGLDTPSRQIVQDLMTKTIQGFRPDILVQGVNAKATAHTQILLITHRAEEILPFPIFRTVTYLVPENKDSHSIMSLHTEDRQDRSGEQLLQKLAPGFGNDTENNNNNHLPTSQAVLDWWHQGRPAFLQSPPPQKPTTPLPVVSTKNLSVQQQGPTNNKNIVVLLQNINWTVQPDQHWWIAGGNGAGKSTLSRLLAKQQTSGGIPKGTLQVNTIATTTTTTTTTSTSMNPNKKETDRRRLGVGWVSTESHLALARSPQSIQCVLTNHYHYNHQQSQEEHQQSQEETTYQAYYSTTTTPMTVAIKVLEWLDMPTHEKFLQRPFTQLSQGEQKLVLIAAAIAARPTLLVLDEPCQGLDAWKRQRVLQLLERICSRIMTDDSNNTNNKGLRMSLIYITHHPEEVIPSVRHVLHLAKGQDFYQGSREEYNVDAVMARAESILSNQDNREDTGTAKQTVVA